MIRYNVRLVHYNHHIVQVMRGWIVLLNISLLLRINAVSILTIFQKERHNLCRHLGDRNAQNASYFVANMANSKLKRTTYTRMDDSLKRLATFAVCDPALSEKVSPLFLARNGFYYGREGDQLICSSCQLAVDDWRQTDSDCPLDIHRRRSPRCRYVVGCKRLSSQGIATLESDDLRDRETGSGHRKTFTSLRDEERFGRTESDNGDSRDSSRWRRPMLRDYEHTGSIESNARRETFSLTSSSALGDRANSDFSNVDARLLTFRNWPSEVQARQLAADGFISAGSDDVVRCVFCQRYLNTGRLAPVNSLAEEHFVQFPDCPCPRRKTTYKCTRISSTEGRRGSTSGDTDDNVSSSIGANTEHPVCCCCCSGSPHCI